MMAAFFIGFKLPRGSRLNYDGRQFFDKSFVKISIKHLGPSAGDRYCFFDQHQVLLCQFLLIRVVSNYKRSDDLVIKVLVFGIPK